MKIINAWICASIGSIHDGRSTVTTALRDLITNIYEYPHWIKESVFLVRPHIEVYHVDYEVNIYWDVVLK